MRAVLVLALATACARPSTPLTVAAASDLATALPKIGALFTAKTGVEVVYSFGSSGLLAKQVAQGGPFDVFAAAQARYVDEAVASGRCARRTPYAIGRLAVLGSTRALTLAELTRPSVKRVAIANPEHAPYGVAAKETFSATGIEGAVAAKLVFADNARHAAQMAETGNVEAALVPLALVRGEPKATPVDAALHAPILQTITSCGPRAAIGDRFIEVLLSPEGRAVLEAHGFGTPGEGPSDPGRPD